MTSREELHDFVVNAPAAVEGIVVKPDPLLALLDHQAVESNDSDPTSSDLLTTAEAGRKLSAKPATVAKMCRDGRLPNAFKTSGDAGEWRIPVGDVREYPDSENGDADRIRFD